MRLFITGGTGFFGQAIDEYLHNFPEIETLSLSRSRIGPGFLTGDIRTIEFPDEQFDAVLHMSLESEGTRGLLQWARTHGVKNFLFTSSGAVYDHCTSYADHKREAEMECLKAMGMRITIARCFTFVGPRLPLQSNFAIGNFIHDALNSNRIEVKGSAIRSYLYTSDLAEWLMAILMEGDGIYDVGSEHEIGMVDLAHLVRDIVNPSANIVITGTGGARYVPDTTRAREILGLKEIVTLSEAIKRTADYSLRQIR